MESFFDLIDPEVSIEEYLEWADHNTSTDSISTIVLSSDDEEDVIVIVISDDDDEEEEEPPRPVILIDGEISSAQPSVNQVIDNEVELDFDFLENYIFSSQELRETPIDAVASAGLYGGVDDDLFRLTREFERNCKRFKCRERVLEFESTDVRVDDFMAAMDKTFNFFQQLRQNYIAPLEEHIRVRLMIDHSAFVYQINLPFLKRDDVTAPMMMDEFDRVVQSRKKDPQLEVTNRHKIKVSIIIAEIVVGGARKPQSKENSTIGRVEKKSAIGLF